VNWNQLATYALGVICVILAFVIPGLPEAARYAVFGTGCALLGLATPHPLQPKTTP
jgi:hypothetical protein